MCMSTVQEHSVGKQKSGRWNAIGELSGVSWPMNIHIHTHTHTLAHTLALEARTKCKNVSSKILEWFLRMRNEPTSCRCCIWNFRFVVSFSLTNWHFSFFFFCPHNVAIFGHVWPLKSLWLFTRAPATMRKKCSRHTLDTLNLLFSSFFSCLFAKNHWLLFVDVHNSSILQNRKLSRLNQASMREKKREKYFWSMLYRRWN